MAGLQPRILSATNMKMFMQCLLKFWFNYIKKEKSLDDSIHLRFGSAVHKAMENLGKRLLAGEPLTAELCEEIAQTIPSLAAQYRISDPKMITEAQGFVRDRLYKHNPNYRIISTEMNMLKANLTTDRGVPLTGVIDLLMEMDPNTAVVLDYKTSRMADSVESAKSDIQLSLYSYMIHKLYPQYNHVWLVLDFLRSEPVISERDEIEMNNFEVWLNELWATMGRMTEKDVVPTINGYCPWCGYKHLCHEYASLFSDKVTLTPVIGITSPDEFTGAYIKAKALEKIIANRITELKEWSDRRVAYDGTVKFEDNTHIVSWGQGTRKYYDPTKVLPHLPMDELPKLVNLKNKELEEFSGRRPDLKPIIERAMRTSPSAPRLTTRAK
jgi:RecB family exonuclease